MILNSNIIYFEIDKIVQFCCFYPYKNELVDTTCAAHVCVFLSQFGRII